jgi:serine/threonine protein kinase
MDGIADYRFVERLGEGNHGTFWLAEPPDRLGLDVERVAVKTLVQRASEQDFNRMANELRVYAAVDSPYLVPVLDAGQQHGRLFYATTYHPDGSLAAPTRPLTEVQVLAAVADAAAGAHALHEAGIAHRDIKPANVLLCPAEVTERHGVHARLSDLGLAQILNPGQTVTGIGPVGSIEYLSPEMVAGHAASRASDVWALGATLHRALTGTGIFPQLPSGSLLDALRYLTDNRPVIDPVLGPAVAAVIDRCLDENPGSRFLTAAEMAEAVRAVHGVAS